MGTAAPPPVTPAPLPLFDNPYASYPTQPPPYGWPTAPPIQMAPPGTVTVSFAPKRAGYVYRVAVGNQMCDAPCSLYLKPGPARLDVNGAARYHAKIVVPNSPASVTISHRRLYKLVAGAIVTGIGVVASLTAVGTYLTWSSGGDGSNLGWAVLSALVAIPLLPIGIYTMAVTDGDRVQVARMGGVAEREEAPKLRLVGAGITPLPGGAGAGLSFAF
jgi:hypothetical protein